MQHNKKISAASLLALSLFLSACGNQNVTQVVQLPVETGTDQSIATSTSTIPPASVAVPVSIRGSTKLTASTTLPPDGYFEYPTVNMLDLDYSTAWCSTRADKTPVITLHFDKAVPVKTVGMVTGFGRDETIFKKNNRIKKIDAWFDDKSEEKVSYEFEDRYGMQFFDMRETTATDLHIKITDVYPGSKFKDTCVAEIDLWSDWVTTKDGAAADTYYKDFKFQQAFEPINQRDIKMTQAGNLTACGQIGSKYKQGSIDEDGYDYSNLYKETNPTDSQYPLVYHYNPGEYVPYSFDLINENSEKISISAKLNSHFKEGDTIQFKYLVDRDLTSGIEYIPGTPATSLLTTHDAVVKKCSDGGLYVSDTNNNAGSGGMFGENRVDLYANGKLIGRQRFSFSQ